MWEEEPERFLQDKALLPLATLTRTSQTFNFKLVVFEMVDKTKAYL